MTGHWMLWFGTAIVVAILIARFMAYHLNKEELPSPPHKPRVVPPKNREE